MLKLKISTKVEFGIIAVIDIASHSLNGNAVTTPEIAKRQNISKKYLEQILSSLSSAGLVRGQKGSNGGYVIAKATHCSASSRSSTMSAPMLRSLPTKFS